MKLPATTIRSALIDYRAELIRINRKFPEVFKYTHPQLIAQIDEVLLSIEGNITEVEITPATCRI
jgi:hypothetical protein